MPVRPSAQTWDPVTQVRDTLAPDNTCANLPHVRFWPDVPEGAQGWGAKGELRVERIVGGAK